MPTFSNTWFERAIPYWKMLFTRLGWMDGRALEIVEIGSFEGQSTLWMLDNLLAHPDSVIHCVDSFAGGIEHGPAQTEGLMARFSANVAESANAAKVRVVRGLSRDGLIGLIGRGVTADIIYVDASHQAPDVLEDLVLAFRLLKIGGMMVCDDYLWSMEKPGSEDPLNAPKVAIDAFVNIYLRKIQPVHYQPLYQFAFRKRTE